MRLAAATLLCALAGCEIDIDLDNRIQLDAGLPVTPAVTCPPRAVLVAYRVTIDPTPLPAACWSDGGVPADATLPAETFEALIIQGTTLSISGLSPQRLGDAPPLTVGAAFAGNDLQFEWKSESVNPQEPFQTRALFTFERVDTRETAGTILLEPSSKWRSCTALRTFRATAIEPSAAWTLTTAPLENSNRYLAVLDLGALSRSDLTCSTPPPATRVLTPGLRAIEVWQIAWPRARISPRSVELAGAPTIDVESDFGPFPQQHVSQLDAGVDARETRTTGAQLILPCMNPVNIGLELTSRYECAGAGCAALSAADSGSCSVRIPYSVYAL